ncbi:ribose-phosphate diphosphokinase [Sediminispirochaeta smaragdinae]|uniref:ribose-phosphate diphosphokinase n=1 Tax=Sediminispirochaeta smaragdinae (strain DSM 11293 / JCM 15392 / SEBR 4228) TaxID=573413 RepID=E1R531_SEDSS|nr:ribose-phosphate diphosphokinase [Sediminispirochaeta smaragdinae]ADK80566.1 ribose-phosphate pyrophosphokinase [Sediminispirochaeta smaragdinae DSM 11293]
MQNVVIVGTVADNPVVEDVAHHLQQHEDYSDLISLKSFVNTEFCPRFIISDRSNDQPGRQLEGKAVVIISTNYGSSSRDELAMRTLLIARAARDNGADKVILLEPDLFYSAQDRGPRREHGYTAFVRNEEDYQKFDGQPFSARLYADLLKAAGVDEIVTVHNHSVSVQAIFMDRFEGRFHNLLPDDLYADYISDSDVVSQKGMVLCAPDKGALDFVRRVKKSVGRDDVPLVFLDKCRKDERCVEIDLSPESEIALSDLAGRDIVIIDDMVRTGNTIIEACRLLKSAGPNRIVFFVTHFYSSRECRSNLNDSVLDEIVTTSTIPEILNRDVQGRLRHKMVVLQLSRWISNYLLRIIQPDSTPLPPPFYNEDMSSKNPRWKGHMGPLFSVR